MALTEVAAQAVAGVAAMVAMMAALTGVVPWVKVILARVAAQVEGPSAASRVGEQVEVASAVVEMDRVVVFPWGMMKRGKEEDLP